MISSRRFLSLCAFSLFLSHLAVAAPAKKKAAPSLPASEVARPFRLIVPVMGLDVPVARGTDNEALRQAPGYDPLTALPGQRGNCVIASHRNVHGAYFWYLTKIRPGALITLQTPRKSFHYKVISASLVAESQTGILEHNPNDASAHLTLYTCTLPVSGNRYVVVAKLVPPGIVASPIAIPGAFNRPALVPEITSGPLHLLKDKALYARYRSLLRYARGKAEQPIVLPEGGAKVDETP